MEIQQISSDDLKEYKYFSGGIESKIYIKDQIAIKKYYDDITENKIKKIKILHELNLPFLTNPKSLIKIDGEINSFSMEFKKGYYPISNSRDLPTIVKLELLVQLLEIIENLHKNNIIYGDLNPNNVICNDEDIYLTDIVNAKVYEYPFDARSVTMKHYFEQGGQEEYLDYYMFNLLTIYYLNEIEYRDLLPVIENTLFNYFNNKNENNIIGLTDNLDCLNIGYQMLNPTSSIDLFINHINFEAYKNKTKN